MKLILIAALAFVAVAVAAPVEEKPVYVVLEKSDSQPDGQYAYGYTLDNGVRLVQVGRLTEVRNEKNEPITILSVSGKYSYVNADGVLDTIEYVADENGYRATGPAIPQI